MSAEVGTGILGLSPDWLKYGALGLLAISILVVAVVTFSGAKSRASFRLALLFMGFTLIVAALAIGSEIFRESAAVERITQERDDWKAKAESAAAALAEADKAAGEAKSQMTAIAATVSGEIGKIANALDAKWCVEVVQMEDTNVKGNLAFLIGQMRGAIAAIEKAVGAPPSVIPNECADIGNP